MLGWVASVISSPVACEHFQRPQVYWFKPFREKTTVNISFSIWASGLKFSSAHDSHTLSVFHFVVRRPVATLASIPPGGELVWKVVFRWDESFRYQLLYVLKRSVLLRKPLPWCILPCQPTNWLHWTPLRQIAKEGTWLGNWWTQGKAGYLQYLWILCILVMTSTFAESDFRPVHVRNFTFFRAEDNAVFQTSL